MWQLLHCDIRTSFQASRGVVLPASNPYQDSVLGHAVHAHLGRPVSITRLQQKSVDLTDAETLFVFFDEVKDVLTLLLVSDFLVMPQELPPATSERHVQNLLFAVVRSRVYNRDIVPWRSLHGP